MTIFYKPPQHAFAPNLQESINAQKQDIVAEIKIYDPSPGLDIWGYSWEITSGPFRDNSQDKWCSVIFDTYNEALTSVWRHIVKLQLKHPYWFGDATILGLPEDTTFTISDNPQTYRPYQTLHEMDNSGIDDTRKAQEYFLNISFDNEYEEIR